MSKYSKYIEYQSKNGFKGILYGRSTFAIFDKDGNEVLHTGNRNINTYEELVKLVECFPGYYENLKKCYEEEKEEDDGI